MAFRNVMIESPARVSVKNNQLLISTDREHSLSMEDISALLLESRQSTITTAALSLLGQSGCTLFICDEKHMPCAVMTPFSQHSRALAAAKLQLAAAEPMKKRLWQSIVKSKINKHRNRLKQNLPDNGSVRLLVITEKQYESIDILVGRLTQADESFQCEQLSIF